MKGRRYTPTQHRKENGGQKTQAGGRENGDELCGMNLIREVLLANST